MWRLDPIVRTSDTDGGGYRTGSWQARKQALYFRTNAAKSWDIHTKGLYWNLIP